MKKNRLLILSMTVLLACASTLAQQILKATPDSTVNQRAISSLSSLPEADTLIYLSPQRILNEAIPKLMPEKYLAQLRSGLNTIKQSAGIDPSKIDYAVIAIRSRKPSAELNFIPPEFMVVTSGDFSTDTLMILAKAAAGNKLRDEKYGAKSISLMTIDPVAKEAEKKPMLKSYSEMAIVSLNANTIAVGTTAYVKAAVDAAAGEGRISSENLNSLLRDPNALISIAGSPLTSFSRSFGLLGTEASARAPRCDSRFGDFYAAITMDATNFKLRGAMNADNPDTAKIMNSLLSGLLQQATGSISDKTAQSAVKTLSITPEDNEIVLRADIPQQMVIDFIQEQLKPKAAVTVSAPVKTAAPAKKPPIHRGRRPTN
jgi:hypothetical protein